MDRFLNTKTPQISKMVIKEHNSSPVLVTSRQVVYYLYCCGSVTHFQCHQTRVISVIYGCLCRKDQSAATSCLRGESEIIHFIKENENSRIFCWKWENFEQLSIVSTTLSSSDHAKSRWITRERGRTRIFRIKPRDIPRLRRKNEGPPT